MSVPAPPPTQARSRLDPRMPQRRPHLDRPRRAPLPPRTLPDSPASTIAIAIASRTERRTTTILNTRRLAGRAVAGNMRSAGEAASDMPTRVPPGSGAAPSRCPPVPPPCHWRTPSDGCIAGASPCFRDLERAYSGSGVPIGGLTTRWGRPGCGSRPGRESVRGKAALRLVYALDEAGRGPAGVPGILRRHLPGPGADPGRRIRWLHC
jgi:hypothetical protein